eukprot:100813-Chlamydomonas_euryale.AAC.4
MGMCMVHEQGGKYLDAGQHVLTCRDESQSQGYREGSTKGMPLLNVAWPRGSSSGLCAVTC